VGLCGHRIWSKKSFSCLESKLVTVCSGIYLSAASMTRMKMIESAKKKYIFCLCWVIGRSGHLGRITRHNKREASRRRGNCHQRVTNQKSKQKRRGLLHLEWVWSVGISPGTSEGSRWAAPRALRMAIRCARPLGALMPLDVPSLLTPLPRRAERL